MRTAADLACVVAGGYSVNRRIAPNPRPQVRILLGAPIASDLLFRSPICSLPIATADPVHRCRPQGKQTSGTPQAPASARARKARSSIHAFCERIMGRHPFGPAGSSLPAEGGALMPTAEDRLCWIDM